MDTSRSNAAVVVDHPRGAEELRGLRGPIPLGPRGHGQGAPGSFSLESFFSGAAKAYGVVHDRFGTLKRRFAVDLEGRWDGRTLTLDEDFSYDDGSQERRTWEIVKLAGGRYEGSCPEVIGHAHGTVDGDSFSWSYRFALPIGRRRVEVRFDDWFCLLEPDLLLNRARITKFGILLAEATIIFRR